jgi:uracil-DNA glycosylase family 4
VSWQDSIRNPDCELCPLHEGAEHVCLMGTGSKKSRIMIVGEAPGAREDEEHAAFVGKAGKLLDKLLKRAGIERKDCYITNVAKCRPPDNRTPERSEIKTCVETYLRQELEAVDPDFILLVGNSALQGVVGKSGITKHRGYTMDTDGTRILGTFHPAAALRTPRLLKEIDSDIKRFGRLVRGEETSPETRIKTVRTVANLKWLIEELADAKELTVDIETYVSDDIGDPGEEWHDESVITSIAFTWEEGVSAVVPLHHEHTPWRNPNEVLKQLALWLPGRKVIAHNGKYDLRWLTEKTGLKLGLSFDTMLAAHMLDENRAKGLKPLSQLQLGADAYGVGEDKKRTFYMPQKRLVVYNGRDTDYTHRLYHRFRDELKDEPRIARVFQKLMMPASNALVDIERRGIYVDRARWRKVMKKTSENEEKLRKYIHQWVPKDKQYGPTRGKNKMAQGEVNLNAPMQVAEFVFGDLGLPILELTKKEAPSTKESVLLQLKNEHKAVEALLKWRKWNKYLTTYVRPFGLHVDKQNRYHPSYRLFGTVTGRLSAQGAIQQVPRDTFIRGLFGSPPGSAFVEADYSQIELRIAAMLANERHMLHQFEMGKDIHMTTAMRVTGKAEQDITKEERKRAKAVNFGYLYGMGASKFVTYARDNYEVDVSEAEAQADRDKFFEEYPRLVQWHERQRRLVRRYKRVHSPIGRVRHLPDVDSQDKEVRAEAERQAINSPVQSLASDMMLLALIRLNQLGIWVIGSIHDALLFEVPEKYVEPKCQTIYNVMTDLSVLKRKFGTEITVPIEVDISIGTHWGEGEPWVPSVSA